MSSGNHAALASEGARVRRVLQAAATAPTEIEFIGAVLASPEGVDIRACQWAAGGRDVVGYSVGLRGSETIFSVTHSGALTLNKLRPRWAPNESPESLAAAAAYWRGEGWPREAMAIVHATGASTQPQPSSTVMECDAPATTMVGSSSARVEAPCGDELGTEPSHNEAQERSDAQEQSIDGAVPDVDARSGRPRGSLRRALHRRRVTVVNGVEYPRRKPAPRVSPAKLTWRGWEIPGGGATVRMDAPPEWRGPSTQVAGLYPFSTGTSLPMIGTPLGDNLNQRGTVCGDPVSWYVHGLIANPSGFVMGRPGRGKSSLVNRMVIAGTWRGIIPIIPADYKGEYVRTIKNLGGKALSPRLKGDHVNPLDRGPLWALLAQLPNDEREAAVADINLRRQNVLAGLCELALGRTVETHELNVLVRAMEVWDLEHPDQTPLISDLLSMVQGARSELQDAVHARGNVDRYFGRVEGVLDALTALAGQGYFGDMFACHTSINFELGRPLCFDLSWLDSGDARMQAGVQLVLWSYTSAAVASAKFAAQGGLMPQQLYLLVFDELWRSLKTTSFMVHRINEITRLNRTLGLGQIMCTHTMEDLTLADKEASAVAQGFVERSEMVWMGGLAPAEMGNLAKVFAMSRTEQAMLESWSVAGDINPATGQTNPPPGRGKFLMKVGQQTAVAFQTRLTQAELINHNTDEAWDATRATQTGSGGRAA